MPQTTLSFYKLTLRDCRRIVGLFLDIQVALQTSVFSFGSGAAPKPLPVAATRHCTCTIKTSSETHLQEESKMGEVGWRVGLATFSVFGVQSSLPFLHLQLHQSTAKQSCYIEVHAWARVGIAGLTKLTRAFTRSDGMMVWNPTFGMKVGWKWVWRWDLPAGLNNAAEAQLWRCGQWEL